MPSRGPGQTFDAIATKQVLHGAPAVELSHPGIANKSSQPPAMAPSAANATLAQTIAIGEEFVIDLMGVHEISNTYLPASAVAGDQIFIKASDNSLVRSGTAMAAGVLNAGYLRFGVIDWIDTTLGRFQVNFNLRAVL